MSLLEDKIIIIIMLALIIIMSGMWETVVKVMLPCKHWAIYGYYFKAPILLLQVAIHCKFISVKVTT